MSMPGRSRTSCVAAIMAWIIAGCGTDEPTREQSPILPCGDGVCREGETARSCPADCPAVCGDGACTAGESCTRCAADCDCATLAATPPMGWNSWNKFACDVDEELIRDTA